MTRFDLYTTPHKALRVLLFDAVTAVGRTDFGNEEDLAGTLVEVRRALRFTGLHTAQEDREIHPLLHSLAPELAADLEAAHDRLDGLACRVEESLRRMEGARTAERVSLGRSLQLSLGPLVADHLEHMALEEARASRILWAHCADAELRAVQERMLAPVPSAELAEWLELVLRAGTPHERAALSAAAAAPAAARQGGAS